MTAPLTYKGHPVPYIAAWTNEHLPQPKVITAANGIAFEDALGANGHAQGSDPDGVLWQRWSLRQGDGTPEFNIVHAPRQRRAMRKMLCQVCGGPSDENEQGRLFLLEDERDSEGWPEEEITTHPPLCLACAPVAARMCPHLQGKVVAVRARQVIVDGVYGQTYVRTKGPIPVLGERKVVLTHNWQARWIVGAQQAASLMDVTVVDLEALGAGTVVRTAPVRTTVP